MRNVTMIYAPAFCCIVCKNMINGGKKLNSKLSSIMKNGELVALYSDENNTESFMVGYICRMKDNKIMILNVGIHGEYDGFTGIYADDIFRIETGSKYLNKIELLQNFNTDEFKYDEYEDIFCSLIKMGVDNGKIVAFANEAGEEIRGFVLDNSEVLNIQEIDEYGEVDGENIIKIEDVCKITVDDVECRDIEKLYKLKKDRHEITR